MLSASKPSWQQVTALVSLSASGTVTGFSFVPHSPTDLMSPTSMPVRLMALQRSVQPTASGDAALRRAIVNVANYYLRMAEGKTPAEMEAIIWQHDSVDGVDHGESCAAFASLTLELAAQVVGQQSWVTGGTSYPWPLHKWADVRVDPNPSSPNITSVLQDAEAHGRWHALGDGYQPQPGDWVLFDNHVEVVTKYADGRLYTIGGDSLPDFSVNSHEYSAPLSGDGIAGFVNNGDVPTAAASSGSGTGGAASASTNGAGSASTNGAGSASTNGAATTATSNDSTEPASVSTGSAPGHAAAKNGAATPAAAGGRVATQAATSGGAAGSAAIPGAPTAPVSHATNTSISGTVGTSIPGTAGTSIPGATGTAGSGATSPATAGGGKTPAPAQRARRSPTAASAHEPRALPTVPGVATTARTTSASAEAAVPGTPSSVVPAAHIAHQIPTRRQAPPVRHAATAARPAHPGRGAQPTARAANADVPGMYGLSESVTTAHPTTSGSAAVPGVAEHQSTATAPYRRHEPTQAAAPVHDTWAQQAFIDEIAPGAIATQQKYGIPAAVTIAQAIDESGWGQSQLATQDNNLFGIKGDGPAGSDSQPTQEYQNGQWVTINAGFRVYDDVTQSIDDHGELLATSGYYTQAMTDRNDPDAFANALTGIYATNPNYGSDLIQLMQQYDLYRYDASTIAPAASTSTPRATAPAKPTHTSTPAKATTKPNNPTQPSLPGFTSTPTPVRSPSPRPTQMWSPAAAGTAANDHVPGGRGSSSATSPARAARTPQARTSPTPQPTSPAHAGRTPQARTSPTPQPTSPPHAGRTPQPRTSPTPQPTSRRRDGRAAEPVVSPTDDAGWVAGSGIAMGTALTELRRRSKRGQRGYAVDPDDQPVPTTISSTLTAFVERPAVPERPERPWPTEPDPDRPPVRRYQHRLPTSVKNDFVAMARGPLLHGELLYRDIADSVGLSWELLAACDWMQCQARPRYSPVHGEKLGARNHDGTVYWSRSEALERCAMDLVDLADAVYGIDLATELQLSVADLARVFAAFRWGALLKRHRTSAMEFPYSVAGLTVQHMNMRWPNIGDPNTPDKPGARFRKPFGAVPIVLSLHYPATI